MELSSILISLVFMLGVTAICVILFERLGFGSVLGFIIAGIIIGPHTPGPVASQNVNDLQNVAELGLAGGSGFIAAFSGGLLPGALAKDHRDDFLRAAEGTGDTMALIIWVIFGSAVVGHAIVHFNWAILAYAILSLTVIRMLPVFLALAGLNASTEAKLFMGWFGRRGLASIVFTVIVVNAHVPNSGPIAMTVVCTIMLSIVTHGVSANPWARGLGERSQMAQGVASAGDS
jgi:NhaP-type Na+/H+ or K+/H+ antiporter